MTDERTKEEKAFDAHLDEMAMNHEFKPRPDSFKREMVAFEQIHRFLYSTMSDVIETTGNYIRSLSVMEDYLTLAEYFTLEAFYNWIEAGGKDCPDCKGDGWLHNLSGEDEAKEDKFKGDRCPNTCIDGKIEVETSFTVFKSQEEYDAEIIRELKNMINILIPIGTIDKMSHKKLGNALADINNIINGLNPKARQLLNNEQPARQSGGENNK